MNASNRSHTVAALFTVYSFTDDYFESNAHHLLRLSGKGGSLELTRHFNLNFQIHIRIKYKDGADTIM